MVRGKREWTQAKERALHVRLEYPNNFTNQLLLCKYITYIRLNMSNSYSIRSTKIGNSAGFRLSAEFYREHPQFANADGWIEVLSPDTAILRIVPQPTDDEDAEDSVMMRLFLDFAMTEALKNNTL
uniref:hypothetical protein n=1 Tax=Hassallia byssoidea TaxID=482630 RepID=UPI001F1E9AAE|nr:hypothetical protein [Hassalia byssoidea]